MEEKTAFHELKANAILPTQRISGIDLHNSKNTIKTDEWIWNPLHFVSEISYDSWNSYIPHLLAEYNIKIYWQKPLNVNRDTGLAHEGEWKRRAETEWGKNCATEKMTSNEKNATKRKKY